MSAEMVTIAMNAFNKRNWQVQTTKRSESMNRQRSGYVQAGYQGIRV